MKIDKFTVENFRSITKAYELPLGNLTILIGPNNEGKSNLLHALFYSLQELKNFGSAHGNRLLRRRLLSRKTINILDDEFSWERDFPVPLQSMKNKRTRFFLEFSLTNDEKKLFERLTKYRILNTLGIKIILGRNDEFEITPCDGKNEIKTLNNSEGFRKISDFLNDSWNFQYIPAVRPTQLTVEIIDRLIDERLKILESNKSYSNLSKLIEKKQAPILKKLSKDITKEMKTFLPTVKKIDIITHGRVSRFIRQASVVRINDGYETDIEMKGDGIKSLLAVSLLRNSVKKDIGSDDKDLTLAIEEPEAHLHPRAIQNLKSTIDEISENNQVIITTHSPIFINRLNLARNIIVNSSNAVPAKSINQLRDVLGVEVSDNLQSAKFILLVEGESDSRIISSVLETNNILNNSIKNGILKIVSMEGSTNLSYQLKLYQSLLCNTYVFIDNDGSARDSLNKALSLKLTSTKKVFLTKLTGFKNSEIEDFIDPRIYIDYIYDKYGVKLEGKKFRNNKKCWSDRVKDTFDSQGKHWSDAIESNVKEAIADVACSAGLRSLSKSSLSVINSLISTLNRDISENK